jgi:hypothetical protein
MKHASLTNHYSPPLFSFLKTKSAYDVTTLCVYERERMSDSVSDTGSKEWEERKEI